ncbi:MAG: response regulator [Gemmatimonadales bacterium]
MAPPMYPSPDRGRGSSRSPVRALVGTLQAALASLGDPRAFEGDDPSSSIHRLVLALLDAGIADGRPDLQQGAEQILAATMAELPALANGWVAALPVEMHGPEQVILVVEDDHVFGATLATALHGKDRRIEVVETCAAARTRLASGDVSLVVLDLILPDGDGRNLLLELRSDPTTAGTPLFVVSARLGAYTKGECFALGADAYFEKPLDIHAFAVAVSSRLERLGDGGRMLRRDATTGLANRAAFLESASHLRLKSPAGTPFTLAVLDLDHFRWVEETWGRQFADSVLRRAGVRLSMSLPQAASFARWDGAAFIAFFAGRGIGETTRAVEQALDTLRQVDFRQGQEGGLHLTFSAGVVEAPLGQSIEEVLGAADRLCFLAKGNGRNRVLAGGSGAAPPAIRVLVAEDDRDILRLLDRQLRAEGFEPLLHEHGAAALAAFPTSGAGLIISDIEMPEMDGLEFLRQVRAHPAGRHIPIMMLTAMGDEKYVVRAFELGADEYVTKPFLPREVMARVRRLLRRPSVAGIPAPVE